MASETKITISEHELVCLLDTGFLLTKQALNSKVQALLLQLAQSLAQGPIPTGLQNSGPKISKGENYRGLPYWVLDYPAVFGRSDVFAYRTICRWGHEFSFTLLLSGRFYNEYKLALAARYQQLSAHTALYLCINNSPWEHHYEADNYKLFAEVISSAQVWEDFLRDNTFLKLTFQMPLDEWNGAVDRGAAVWQEWLKILLLDM